MTICAIKTLHIHLYYSIIHSSQGMNQHKIPSRKERLKKMWYTHNEFYAAVKSETMLFSGKGIEIEDIISSKINQTQRDNNHTFPCMWNMDVNICVPIPLPHPSRHLSTSLPRNPTIHAPIYLLFHLSSCIPPPTHIPAYPSIHPHICLSIHSPIIRQSTHNPFLIHLPIHRISVYPPIRHPTHPPAHPSTLPSTYTSIHIPTPHSPTHPFSYLFIHQSAHPYILIHSSTLSASSELCSFVQWFLVLSPKIFH